jgi:uncharacterized OB-fold protein
MTDDLGRWYSNRPRPQIDNVSRHFWESARRHVLLYQGCDRCQTVQFYPRALCAGCGAEPQWKESTGRGAIHTFTVIRQHGSSPFREQLPYVVAMIDVEPGFRIMGNVFHVDPDSVYVGMPVEVGFADVDDELTLPVWSPLTDTARNHP